VLSSPGGSDPVAVTLPVTEASQAGEARRLATTLAARLGFNETERAKVALVVTEAAGNLVKHAQRGELLLQPLDQDGVGGLDVLALDRGPGMKDVGRCLLDGFSTAGSPGTGLGAIARLADSFDLYSAPPTGTVLLARLWSRPLPPPAPAGPLAVAAVSVPKARESVCGDAWAVEHQPGRTLILVADGLGHGPGAAQASREAVRLFRGNARLDPAAIVQTIHAALRSTRGAAVAVAAVDCAAEEVRFVGLGNIAGCVLTGAASRSLVSHNGTAGHALYKIQEFVYPFPKGALLVLNSDGLLTRWQLDAYPGLTARNPALVAAVLYRDFNRGRDDVTVVAARAAAPESPS
jgi:anti-sigma regulatory factor (Ser/Thr protein kinase)